MSFISHIKEEFQVIQERDPGNQDTFGSAVISERVMIKYRRAHKLYLKGRYFLARWISQRGPERPGLRFIRVLRLEKGCLLTMEAV